MHIKHIRWVLPALLMLALAGQGCTDQDEIYVGRAVMRPVEFRANGLVDVTVHGATPTRVGSTTFETNDQLSIWAVRTDSVLSGGLLLSMPSTFSDSSYYWTRNACYQVDAYGALTCISDNPVMQFDDSLMAMPMVYYVSYPYSSNRDSTFSFAVKADQSISGNYTASDLAMQCVGPITASTVNLTLQHKLTNIVVRLTGTDLTSKDITVEFLQVYLCVKANQNTQTVVSGGTKLTCSRSDVTFGEDGTPTSTQRQYHAIVAPQTIADGKALLRVTVDGDTLTGIARNTGNLRSGQQCMIQLDISDMADGDNIYLNFGGDESGGQDADVHSQTFEWYAWNDDDNWNVPDKGHGDIGRTVWITDGDWN